MSRLLLLLLLFFVAVYLAMLPKVATQAATEILYMQINFAVVEPLKAFVVHCMQGQLVSE